MTESNEEKAFRRACKPGFLVEYEQAKWALEEIERLRDNPVLPRCSGQGIDPKLLWCAKHRELVVRYSDGSQSCRWELICETNSNECRVIDFNDRGAA